ncbi:MAG: N-formylglutamate amidohydrolase [Alphaproteobacteria bacterium]|nr:N-formylglutamate amidohydrolase [Alphaproteobacteria bacterium]
MADETAISEAAIHIARPAVQTAPLVFASPHSGRRYPPDFVRAAALDPETLRNSEDAFVDELFADAPRHGAPLLAALFPRAFVDVNRERYELDPAMFDAPLPAFANTRSARVASGLGTVARVVGDGQEIYRGKLSFAEIETRLERYYAPYHAALEALIGETRRTFGFAVVIDCHSMPSVGGPHDEDRGLARPDIVLGDRYGRSSAPALTALVESLLRAEGLRVAQNAPYAGGYTTQHYGKPEEGVSVVQIELNRGLYMTEATMAKSPGFDRLKALLDRFMVALAARDLAAPGLSHRR